MNLKSLLFVLILILLSPFLFGQTSGGPDAFGYIWKNSNDAEGPVFSWIDISTTGTEVTDLMDDNSVGFFPIGFDFRYYENTYNQFKIGSNGWISFNDVTNISLCFPPVPTSGAGGDNILFAFTADLNHVTASETNPARVYYQNFGDEFVVISFIDVPYWINNSAGFDGSNSFQIIIDSYDNSFTYQYLSLESEVLNALEACFMNTSVGFENADGSDGLQIYSNLDIPANGTAVKIQCPGCFTSINSDKDSKISVYPNPVSDKLFIDAENLVSAKVFNEQGKLISEIFEGDNISFDNIMPGVYTIKLVTTTITENYKIIKLN